MSEKDKFTFEGHSVPSYMREGLRRYVEERCPTGDFLTAVLSNDLKGACLTADLQNLKNLPAYIYYLWNYAPADCWGSREKVAKWLTERPKAPEIKAVK